MPDDIQALNDSLSAQLHELRAGRVHEAVAEEPAPEAEAAAEAETEEPEAEATQETEEPAEEQEAETAGKPAQPLTVKLSLGGREVEVSAEVADLVRRDQDTRAGTYGSDIQRLREQVARLEGAHESQAQEPEEDVNPPDPELLNPASDKFDPREHQRQLLEYNEAVVVAALQDLEGGRRKEAETASESQSRQQAWAQYVEGFYRHAPELAKDRDIVTAVYRASFEDLRRLPSDAAVYEELRRRSNERIQSLVQARAQAKPAPKAPVLSSRRAAAPAPAKGPESEDTLTDLLRERRAAAL